MIPSALLQRCTYMLSINGSFTPIILCASFYDSLQGLPLCLCGIPTPDSDASGEDAHYPLCPL